MSIRTAQAMVTEMHDTGMSEVEIAKQCQISAVQVHRIRRGVRVDPRFSTWQAIFIGWLEWRRVREKGEKTPQASVGA